MFIYPGIERGDWWPRAAKETLESMEEHVQRCEQERTEWEEEKQRRRKPEDIAFDEALLAHERMAEFRFRADEKLLAQEQTSERIFRVVNPNWIPIPDVYKETLKKCNPSWKTKSHMLRGRLEAVQHSFARNSEGPQRVLLEWQIAPLERAIRYAERLEAALESLPVDPAQIENWVKAEFAKLGDPDSEA